MVILVCCELHVFLSIRSGAFSRGGGCPIYKLSSLTIVAICAQPLPLPPFPCCLLIPFACRAFICVCRLRGGARRLGPPTLPMLAYVIRLLVQFAILHLPLLLNCCLMHLLATLVLYVFFVFFSSVISWLAYARMPAICSRLPAFFLL